MSDRTSDLPGSEPRAVRALRTTLLATAVACVVLGVLGSALLVLTGDADPWPGLSLLLAAQAVALVAALVSGTALRRAQRAAVHGADVTTIAAQVRIWLDRLFKALAIVLVAGVTGWVLIRPETWLAVIACALVAGQLLPVLRYLRG